MSYLYIFLTIVFTIYGQLVIKWQVSKIGTAPIDPMEKIFFFIQLLLNPWIMSGFLAAFIAALAWMSAISKLPLSYAYPFMSLSFVFVSVLSCIFFNETLTIQSIIGLSLIVAGIIVLGQQAT